MHHASCRVSGKSGRSAGSGSSPAVPKNRVLNSKKRYLRVRVIWKVKKTLSKLYLFGATFSFLQSKWYLRSWWMRNDRKALCFFVCFVKNDEHRCTVVQNQPCRPSARPSARPPVRPSARPSARPPFRPPVLPSALHQPVRLSVRPDRGRPNLYTEHINSRSTTLGGPKADSSCSVFFHICP